ncbi:hypothetical protein ANN_26772 [Periplaneta americana]|uniref:Uncharacterized protein n=1 Tax=Periplaneta americana TaxID=6978 RepID=A0ABQ8RYZ6_PERAM|nr:hypothetical protein ANN_26772 [Periplaneta americana]
MEEEGNGNRIVSITTFNDQFDAHNLGIFSPKKDQCDVCCSFKTKNITEEEYTNHLHKKEEPRAEKKEDKDNDDVSTVVLTMDMQAVLLALSLKASALYYKTKLKVHNFTIFDINTAEGHCFLWDESEGGVTADEFATAICEFINKIKLDMPTIKKIIFSDGCTFQNRNAVMANALLLTAVQTGVTIQQN